jgi:hypothetical protein
MRINIKLAVIGVAILLAACGGGDPEPQGAPDPSPAEVVKGSCEPVFIPPSDDGRKGFYYFPCGR